MSYALDLEFDENLAPAPPDLFLLNQRRSPSVSHSFDSSFQQTDSFKFISGWETTNNDFLGKIVHNPTTNPASHSKRPSVLNPNIYYTDSELQIESKNDPKKFLKLYKRKNSLVLSKSKPNYDPLANTFFDRQFMTPEPSNLNRKDEAFDNFRKAWVNTQPDTQKEIMGGVRSSTVFEGQKFEMPLG
jgi:hypothetical protein